MAKIIGEASIRLRAETKGLAVEIRRLVTNAIKEGTSGITAESPTKAIADDAEKDGNRITGVLGRILGAGRGLASGLIGVATSGARLALTGAAAGVALAGVTSLVTGLVGLIGAAGQAAGVVGLLPAAFVAVKAVSATLTLALSGVSESFAALASGDMAAFQESLKKLAPSARSFVTEVAKVKPAFDKIKLNLQQTAFEGLSRSIAPLAQRYLPLTNQFFQAIGQSANQGAKSLLDFANNGEVAGQVQLFAQDIATAFNQLMPALAPAASGLLDLGQTGAQFLPQLTQWISSLAVRFGEFMREAAGSGRLEAFFQTAIDTAKQFGQVIQNVFGILKSVFGAAQTAGGGFLNSLVEITGRVREFLASGEGQSALIGFFSAMREIIAAVLPLFTTLAGVIGRDVAPLLAQLAKTLGTALQPVFQALGPAIQAATPGILALAEGLAAMLEAVAPLLPVIGQLAGIVGGALGAVFKAIAPVIQQVATILQAQLAKFLPVLMPVIEQFATALGQVLTALLPMIPVFFQLLAALLPILPPLLQLVAAILPPLISLVQALTPIVVALGQVFAALIPIITEIVQVILGVLIPPIELIATAVSTAASIVSNVFTAMAGLITNVLSAIGSFITGIWQTIVGVFQTAVSTVGNVVNTAFTRVRSFIGDIMGGIGRAVSDGISNVVRFFSELPGKVLGFLGDLANQAVKAGENIIGGIIRGLGNLASAIWNKIKQIVSDAWDSVLDFFGINSPSTLAIWTFEQVGRGIVKGLDNMTKPVENAATALASSAMDALNPLSNGSLNLNASALGGDGAALGVGGGVGTFILNQNNTMLPGADVNQFAAEVWRRGAADLASGNSALNVAQQSVQSGLAAPGSVVNLGA